MLCQTNKGSAAEITFRCVHTVCWELISGAITLLFVVLLLGKTPLLPTLNLCSFFAQNVCACSCTAQKSPVLSLTGLFGSVEPESQPDVAIFANLGFRGDWGGGHCFCGGC